MCLDLYIEDGHINEDTYAYVHFLCHTDPIDFSIHLIVPCLQASWSRSILSSSYSYDWDGKHLLLQFTFHWHKIRHYVHKYSSHDHVLSKRDCGRRELAKVLKTFSILILLWQLWHQNNHHVPQWSHWGSKKTWLYRFLHHWYQQGQCLGWSRTVLLLYTSHILHLKSVLGFRGPLRTFE